MEHITLNVLPLSFSQNTSSSKEQIPKQQQRNIPPFIMIGDLYN